MKIYVVMGERGEYSDYTEWSVCAFKYKASADAWAQKAQERHDHIRHAQNGKGINEFDPCGWIGYDAVTYGVFELDLFATQEQALKALKPKT